MRFPALVICGLMVTTAVMAQNDYAPPAGFVPDAATAISISRAVLIPIYGAKTIREAEPLVARRQGAVWIVTGSMECKDCLGGVAELSLSARDGKILRAVHGK